MGDIEIPEEREESGNMAFISVERVKRFLSEVKDMFRDRLSQTMLDIVYMWFLFSYTALYGFVAICNYILCGLLCAAE